MRGRKAKPAAVKALEGNPGHRPIVQPTIRAPRPTSTPRVPHFLQGQARAEWRRMVKILVQLGLYSAADMAALAMYCQAFGRWVDAEIALQEQIDEQGLVKAVVATSEKGNPYQNPLLSVANAAWEQVRKMLAEFGLSPAARQRLSTLEPPAEQDDFIDQLFKIKTQTAVGHGGDN